MNSGLIGERVSTEPKCHGEDKNEAAPQAGKVKTAVGYTANGAKSIIRKALIVNNIAIKVKPI